MKSFEQEIRVSFKKHHGSFSTSGDRHFFSIYKVAYTQIEEP